MSKSQVLTHEQWVAEAVSRYGEDPMQWKFRCPSCHQTMTVAEYQEAGAPESYVAFSCVGRMRKNAAQIFERDNGTCDYAGGGLFRLNPVPVRFDDGKVVRYFDFADRPLVPETEKAAAAR